MKEILNNKFLPKGTIYKNVIVIGNGPSGISLSYMLAGNWPYWLPDKTEKHPDELLRARLHHADHTKSLIEQDLFELADGLEGRTTNPVSLLLDNLQHPMADLGMEMPCMLVYKKHPEKEIDHVVIGRGPAGGSWHRMDPNLRTLSLAAWMSLPGLDFNEWDERNAATVTSSSSANHCSKCDALRAKVSTTAKQNGNVADNVAPMCSKCTAKQLKSKGKSNSDNKNGLPSPEKSKGGKMTSTLLPAVERVATTVTVPRRNLSLQRLQSKEVETRALISRVAMYYESYATEMGLGKYFLNNAIVTCVAPIRMCEENFTGKFKHAKWIVSGFHRLTNKPFTYISKYLVLANGASDMANRLGVKGEGLSMPWLKYELPHLETSLLKLRPAERSKLKPVMIVGAGLSAADAVSICRSSGIPVIHVFRSRTIGLDKQLPENVYPEYHEVHKMMKDTNRKYDLYTPLPEHTIVDLYPLATSSGGHKVTVQHLKTDEKREIEVSFCAILIGSRPDLRFLSGLETLASAKAGTTTTDTTYDSAFHREIISLHDLALRTLVVRKLLWLKNFCIKCSHLGLCEKSYKKLYGKERKACCDDNNNNSNQATIEGGNGKKRIRCYGLGEDPTKPIDCKNNPIAVDKFTYEVHNVNHNLFAMGPLAGDNFVRFIPGGALAITATLHEREYEDRVQRQLVEK